jgi:microcystin-dependent protein
MSSPFIGEIRMFGGNFAPQGWAFCDGALMAIDQNTALFQLIGTTYGGDGQTTFALPDLQGRVPIHAGTGPGLSTYNLADRGGVEQVTLTTQQIPSHGHAALASMNAGTQGPPTGGVLAASTAVALYNSNAPNNQMHAGTVSQAGGSQPHDNFQPYLCVNFILSLFGIFPSQT